MPGIPSVSGPTPLIGPSPVKPAATPQHSSSKANFAETLKTYVGQVDQQQRQAGMAVQDLVSGKSQDILPVVSAVAQADMSFKLLIGVRNKVIEAYKQTMNMQI